MTAAALCLVLLTTPGLSVEAAQRGCGLAQEFVSSAEALQHDPKLLAAIAWRETRFHTKVVGGSGECGAMQVLPQHSAYTCRQMQNGQGVLAGAEALRRWGSHRNVRRALYRYNCGYKKRGRCQDYQVDVLNKLRSLQRSQQYWLFTGV